jgi:hypothetical protein
MRLTTLAVFVLVFFSHAHPYQYWNEIRHSALLPDSTVTIRVENVYGGGVENYMLYSDGDVIEEAMTPIVDGPSTISATVPGPRSDTRYYGFRLLQAEDIDFMPVRIADGADPVPEDLTRISVDAAGDELFGYTNLDLVDCHMSFSGDRLYGSLTNAGGGFPVIQGLTFFGYLLAIADPALADPDTVFGLMYTYEQAGIISPGLYMITGPGLSDLIKLGDVMVEEFPTDNTLMISCELADLVNDPYFVSWYDPEDPVVGVAGFTQRITILGGPAEADRSPGGQCHMRELGIAPGVNRLPTLANLVLEGEGATAVAEIDYSDADANCPIVAQMVFDDSASYAMYPQGLDYTSAVTYSTEPGIEPLAENSWTSAVLSFSDNRSDSVEHQVPGVGIPAEGWPVRNDLLRACVAPNPSSGAAVIEFVMPLRGTLRIDVYAIEGSFVRTLVEQEVGAGRGVVMWSRRDARGTEVSPGIYFLRVSALGQERVLKLVLVD